MSQWTTEQLSGIVDEIIKVANQIVEEKKHPSMSKFGYTLSNDAVKILMEKGVITSETCQAIDTEIIKDTKAKISAEQENTAPEDNLSNVQRMFDSGDKARKFYDAFCIDCDNCPASDKCNTLPIGVSCQEAFVKWMTSGKKKDGLNKFQQYLTTKEHIEKMVVQYLDFTCTNCPKCSDCYYAANHLYCNHDAFTEWCLSHHDYRIT